MKALILCAGLGTRLKPMTDTMPKCMVNVAGKPCLERIIDHLASFGVTEVIVNVHKFKEQIMEYFGNRLLYFYEPNLLGEAKTEQTLESWLNGRTSLPYLICNGDTLTDLNIREFYKTSMVENQTLESWNGVYTGTKIVFPNTKAIKYEFRGYWQDIGTPEGLEKARKHYGKIKSGILS